MACRSSMNDQGILPLWQDACFRFYGMIARIVVPGAVPLGTLVACNAYPPRFIPKITTAW